MSILPGNKIFANKVDQLNLDFQTQAKMFPMVLPRSPIKIWKSVKGFMSYDRIFKQTNRYIYNNIKNINKFSSRLV